MPSASKALDIFYHLIGPWHMLLFSLSFLPGTIYSLLLSLQLSTIIFPRRLQSAWFARFWACAGTNLRINTTPRIKPLIQEAHGVVLDIGPGGGEWLTCFDKDRVSKIYGVEPNGESHGKLRERIKEAGLEGVYVVIPVGVEDIEAWVEKEGEMFLGKGSVDSVVTVFCLCSVPEPQRMIGELYGYLKEGGNWIVYEHVVTKEKGIIARYQAFVDLFWPLFIGGCSITRDTVKWMKEAGSWSKVNLRQPEEEPPYQMVPHIMGSHSAPPQKSDRRMAADSLTINDSNRIILSLRPVELDVSHTASATIPPPESQTVMAAFGSGFPTPFGASPTATPQAQPDAFAKQLTVPRPAGGTEDDDEDEWEYEYSTAEMETYYVTLDLTDPYHPPERKDVTKAGRTNKMVRWINPVLLMKEEEETKKTMQKEKRTRQHRVYRLGSQGLVDMEVPPDKIRNEDGLDDSEEEEELGSDNNGREDMQSGVESEKVDPKDPENGETNDNEKEDDEFESNKIQIMELHSERPMVMFKERYYDCQWASNVGTEMLFIKHDPDDKNPLPILRTLEGDVDLLAASSQRIMATEVIVEEKREKNSKGKSKTNKKKTRRLRLKDLAIDVGPGADQERRETAKFLEELIYAKLERGELDAVTVDAQSRKSIWKWNEFVMLENRDRINKLKKIIRKGGEDAGDAVKQLAEIEEEEKLREENVELRHKLGGAWKYRYSDKKRKSVLARPAKKPKKGRPVAKKLRMNSPERATTTPGASGTPASGIGSMADSSLDELDSEDEDDEDLGDDSDLEGSLERDSEEDSDEDDSDEEDSSELDDSESSSTKGGDSEDEDGDEDSEVDDSEEMGSSNEDGHRSSDEEQFSDEDEDAHTHGDEDTTMYDDLYD